MREIIKFLVKIPISFFWYFKNFYFYKKVNNTGAYKNTVNDISANGFAIIGKNYGGVSFEQILDDVRLIAGQHESKKAGQEKGRIINLHLLGSSIANYSRYLTAIAAEYFDDPEIAIEMSLYQKSLPERSLSDVPGGEGFHIDDGKKTLKFFLYLTDVNEKNGPFCYIPKTHGVSGLKKLFRIIKWNIFHEHFTLYFDDEEINAQDKILICLERGVVFCADTTGFHRATQLKEGNREILVVSFNEKRLDLVKKPASQMQ